MQEQINLLHEAESIVYYLSNIKSNDMPHDVYETLIMAALEKVQSAIEELEKI